ncbi:hypothetical protein [Caulobacter sp. BK020]|uniref:hypothetical protein n=1 Tax=Caulobacter sp. BK020 TaxID=2512117 RepID=UPI00104F8457|nr:hypothetical protein [Caulobacter sp. BK020]TCS17490.1 hypothetical protein EV278_102254 [Caulobacter sp. BK020]
MSSPDVPLLKIPGALLARARSLISGDEATTPTAMVEVPPFAPKSEVGAEWEPTAQDKSFWASLAAADRRLDDLRRAIDQAAAEAIARDVNAKAQQIPDAPSRYEAAKRMIADALDAEKS